MTIKDFYETHLCRTPGVVYQGHDAVCDGVIVRYYGTKIAHLADCTLYLSALGYSTSTTRRHNILKQIAEARGWTVKEVE